MTRNWKTSFATILVGQMASLIGSSAVQFALIWWVASETGSPLFLGLAGMAAFLPAAVLGPFAGLIADRYHRKYVCICADLSIGLVSALSALVFWVTSPPVWVVIPILCLRSVGGVFHQPALQALIPQLVPQEELVRAGGWQQMASSGAFLLGPVVGAALYAAVSLPVILLTDLLGALLASLLLAIVPIPRHPRTAGEKPSAFQELKAGLGAFQTDPSLKRALVIQTVCMVFALPLATFYPLMTSDYFQATAWHASAVEILYALGMMAASILFGSVLRVRRHLMVSYLGMLGAGLTAAICGLLPPVMGGWVAFAALCGLMGASENVMSIPVIAYMQSTIAPEIMGRAFSAVTVLSSLAMPVGLLLSTPIAEQLGVHRWFLLSGTGIALSALAGLLLQRRQESRDFSQAPPSAPRPPENV